MNGDLEYTEGSFTVNPEEIVKRIISRTDAFGLTAGQRMYVETEGALGFVPWWDHVRIPVTSYFKRMRREEQERQDHLELAKSYAGATRQPVNIHQPSALSAFGSRFDSGRLNVDQLNMLEQGANAIYNATTTQTDNIIGR